MKALTIKQPWVHCILHHGKKIENRSWKPFREVVGQSIALHTSRNIDKVDIIEAGRLAGVVIPEQLPLGHIVGTAVVAGYVVYHQEAHKIERYGDIPEGYDPLEDKWFFGPVGWYLADVTPLPRPLPCAGALGLWDVPRNVLKAIRVLV